MTAHDIALDPLAGTGAQVLYRDGSVRNLTDTHARAHVSPADLPFPPAEPMVLEGVNRTILALDLGTKLGWALRRRDGSIVHGTESFVPRSSWSPGQRGLRMRAWLGQVMDREAVGSITYESVHRHSGVDAAHAYGLFQGLLHMTAETRNIEVTPVGVGVVKKHWTGKGNADKDAMIAEAVRRGFRPADDNAADALAILSWAVAQERAE